MRKNKVPFSWKVEEYAFGAVALREEIQRHKREDTKPWPFFKAIGIRALYLYAYVVSVILVFLVF